MSRRRLMDNKSGVDENTLLLLHGEDFTDSSSRNHSLLVGNATIDNNGKFGKAIKCSGSGYQVRIEKTDFQLGGNDFTFDFWLKLESGASDDIIINMGTINTWAYGYQICLRPSANGIYFACATAPIVLEIPITSSEMKASYNLFSIQRLGSRLMGFLNGTLVAEKAINYSIPNATCQYFYIGSHTAGNGACQILIDEFRFSNIARYNSNFIPPTKPY